MVSEIFALESTRTWLVCSREVRDDSRSVSPPVGGSDSCNYGTVTALFASLMA